MTPPARNRRMPRWLAAGWPLGLLLVFGGLMAVRAGLVESAFGAYVGCPGCFRLPTVSADGWLLAALAGMLLLVVHLPSNLLWRVPARLIGLAVSAMLLAFVADLFILDLFGIRLFFVDLALYGLEPAIVWQQFAAAQGGTVWAILVVLVVLAVALLPVLLPCRRSPAVSVVLGITVIAGLALAWLPGKPDYVNNWIYANVFQANLESSESVKYSPEVAADLEARWESAFPDRCVRGEVDRRNVIVVIVESWSSYQSPVFGGHRQWTPELDAIARAHVAFTRFHAGGFSTNEGLVNLLGGVRLWAPFAHLFEVAEFGYAWGIDDSLVAVFNDAGFHTALLTTGPLDFMRKGEWFRDLGFDHVEGNEHPFYEDWPRVSFHAAADEALYRRALQWLEAQTSEPYFLALETVTTHQPYIDPESGDMDIEGAFAHADRWAAWFYRQLRERGFFDDGVLLITSDHRSMNPVDAAEQERFGPAAAARIPLVLADDRLEGGSVRPEVFQLADLAPSFRHRVHGEACMDAFQASLFEEPPYDGNCAFHLRGSERGIVDVLCADGHGQVRLDGDATAFRSHEGLSPQRRQAVLTAIAADRMEGLRRHREAGR